MKKPSYKNYKNTTIRIEGTQAVITKELSRYGIYEIQHTNQKDRFSVAFRIELNEVSIPLMVRIDVPYNRAEDEEDNYGFKNQRVLYRTLYYYIKTLLNTWDNGLKTFTEIFMPHLVLPGGGTIEQALLPKLRKAITDGKMTDTPLLPKYEKDKPKEE